MSSKKLVLALHLFVAVIATVGADWRETGNYYQIYPRSFKDSDGDGIGDLNGVTQKIQYLKDLGMDAVWLSPIMASPMADFGYDISDYYAIHSEYGTMADFEALLKKCNEIGLKLILDFVPNHTSDESEWFKLSVAGDETYKDFYIWHPGRMVDGQREPPSNWVSAFRFSAWTWNDQRQAYYLHQFAEKQPDLNYRNPKVVEAMKDVIRFWLKKGVHGFRIDAVPFLFEVPVSADGNYPHEPVSGLCDDPMSHCYLKHIYTQDQLETFDMGYQWRQVVDEFDDRVLLIEAYTSLQNIMTFFGNATHNGAQIPFNFELLSNVKKNSTAEEILAIIERWNTALPLGRHSNWVLGNHDNKRIATRLGEGRADLYNILLQTLEGNAVTYYGEEIRMTDGFVSWEETVDPAGLNTNSSVYQEYSRDPCRTPMQWDDSTNAGFSSASETWLPVADNYATVNVKAQETADTSHLKLFKKLTELRKTDVFRYGDFAAKAVDENVLVYRRRYKDEARYVVLNFHTQSITVNLTAVFSEFPRSVKVLAASVGTSGSVIESNFNRDSLRISAETGVILANGVSKPVMGVLMALITFLATRFM